MTEYRLERLQFLAGISPLKLLQLLWRHRFRVRRQRWRDVGQLAFLSLFAGLCNLQDRLIMRRGAQPRALPPPVFIVGHWRSGTTLAHKLLATDPALHAPTFFECCLPRGFVSGSRLIKPRIQAHLPPLRPFDDAPFGVDEPFEDEFVLAKEALVSPMLETVFPASGGRYRGQLQPDALSPGEARAWESALQDFVRRLERRHGKRLLLKSPAHSFRIPALRRLFPGAKFVVLRRDPADVIASTIKMETLLMQHNALQPPRAVDEAWVVARHRQMQLALQQALDTLPPQDIAELYYDALCLDTARTLAALYHRLELPDSPERRAALAAYLHSVAGLRPRRQAADGTARAA